MTKTAPELLSGDYGPPLRGGQRRAPRHRRQVSTIVLTIVAIMTLGLATTVGVLAYVGDGVAVVDIGGWDREQPEVDQGEQGPVLAEVEGVTNVLLVGTDSREGLTDEDLLRLGTEREEGTGLTDTLMLVQLDAEEDRASLLSFPRDLLVERCDGSTGRINGAYNAGEAERRGNGPRCLVETVNNLTGIPIDHYVQVDFEGFMSAVDELGGVSFYLEEPLQDDYAGLDVPAGCVRFDGTEALAFVRARHLGNPPDIGRIARQQRFIREILDEATSAETLRNPARLIGFARAMSSAITTDQGLDSTYDRASLAYTFRELSSDGIDTHVVPGVEDEWNGASVLVPDEELAEPLFAQFRTGSFAAPPQPAAVEPVEPPPPAPAGEAPAPAPVEPERQPEPADADAEAEAEVAPPPPPPLAPSPEPTFAGAARSDVDC